MPLFYEMRCGRVKDAKFSAFQFWAGYKSRPPPLHHLISSSSPTTIFPYLPGISFISTFIFSQSLVSIQTLSLIFPSRWHSRHISSPSIFSWAFWGQSLLFLKILFTVILLIPTLLRIPTPPTLLPIPLPIPLLILLLTPPSPIRPPTTQRILPLLSMKLLFIPLTPNLNPILPNTHRILPPLPLTIPLPPIPLPTLPHIHHRSTLLRCTHLLWSIRPLTTLPHLPWSTCRLIPITLLLA